MANPLEDSFSRQPIAIPASISEEPTAGPHGSSVEEEKVLESRRKSLTRQEMRGSDQQALPTPSPSPQPVPRESWLESQSIADDMGDVSEMTQSEKDGQDSLGTKGTAKMSLLGIPTIITEAAKEDGLEQAEAAPVKPKTSGEDRILKLSPSEIQELTASPESLPQISPKPVQPAGALDNERGSTRLSDHNTLNEQLAKITTRKPVSTDAPIASSTGLGIRVAHPTSNGSVEGQHLQRRPTPSRTWTSQPSVQNRASQYARSSSYQATPQRKVAPSASHHLEPLEIDASMRKSNAGSSSRSPLPDELVSPLAQEIPLPPISIPTFLQLELADTKPSPLYIYRPSSVDRVYESSRLKFERLLNFLLLPPQLEQVLCFGSLACLDSWLYTFTILPLRFCKAIFILIAWWAQLFQDEVNFVLQYTWHGTGRMWARRQDTSAPSRQNSTQGRSPMPNSSSVRSAIDPASEQVRLKLDKLSQGGLGKPKRRRRAQPSRLSSDNKADILQGLLIATSCIILMRLDASRMYHNIKAQSNIKLYVIYNGLEVGVLLVQSTMSNVARYVISFCQRWDRTSLNACSRPTWLIVPRMAGAKSSDLWACLFSP